MCKMGSESHYILSLDALSASISNRLNIREKSLKSRCGYQTVWTPEKKILARIELHSLSYYADWQLY